MFVPTLERRTRPRSRTQLPIVLCASTTPEPRGITRDVSQSGVFFYTDSAMDLGQSVTFKILMPSPGQVSTRALCNGTVVRVEPEGNAGRCGVAVIITSLKLM